MIKEIHGLRFWAIFLVVFVHLGIIVPPDYKALYHSVKQVFHTSTGVELFFIIAGYFLMKSLSKIQTSQPASQPAKVYPIKELLQFFVKKFQRLAPSAYFWCFIAVIFSFITGNHKLWLEPHIMLQKFFATLIWFRNFNEAANPTALGYLWAVSLEMQFFILFPLIYFLIGKQRTLYLSILICFVMAFYRLGGNYNWLFRFDSMLYGVITYYIIEKINSQTLQSIFCTTKFKRLLIACGLLCVLSTNLTAFSAYINLKTTISNITVFIMLLLALSNNNYFYSENKWIAKVLDYFSTRSYAIFCAHIPSWFITQEIFHMFNLNQYLFLAQIGMMLICSEFTYRYIENSLIKK